MQRALMGEDTGLWFYVAQNSNSEKRQVFLFTNSASFNSVKVSECQSVKSQSVRVSECQNYKAQISKV